MRSRLRRMSRTFVLWGCLVTLLSVGVLWPMTLQEARELTFAAMEANKRGDHEEAARSAKRVLDEFGDVQVLWVLPGSVLPDPTADIYDIEGWKEAQSRAMLAKPRTMPPTRWGYGLGGTQAASELQRAYRALKAWDDYAALLEQFYADRPQERERVLQEFWANPESFPRGAAGPPRSAAAAPATLWALARRAAEALEIGIAWNEEARAATFSRDAHLLLVRPGDAAASLDGEPFPLEGAPYIQNDRLILPLSALTKAFHISVTPLEQASVHYWLPK